MSITSVSIVIIWTIVIILAIISLSTLSNMIKITDSITDEIVETLAQTQPLITSKTETETSSIPPKPKKKRKRKKKQKKKQKQNEEEREREILIGTVEGLKPMNKDPFFEHVNVDEAFLKNEIKIKCTRGRGFSIHPFDFRQICSFFLTNIHSIQSNIESKIPELLSSLIPVADLINLHMDSCFPVDQISQDHIEIVQKQFEHSYNKIDIIVNIGMASAVFRNTENGPIMNWIQLCNLLHDDYNKYFHLKDHKVLFSVLEYTPNTHEDSILLKNWIEYMTKQYPYSSIPRIMYLYAEAYTSDAVNE